MFEDLKTIFLSLFSSFSLSRLACFLYFINFFFRLYRLLYCSRFATLNIKFCYKWMRERRKKFNFLSFYRSKNIKYRSIGNYASWSSDVETIAYSCGESILSHVQNFDCSWWTHRSNEIDKGCWAIFQSEIVILLDITRRPTREINFSQQKIFLTFRCMWERSYIYLFEICQMLGWRNIFSLLDVEGKSVGVLTFEMSNSLWARWKTWNWHEQIIRRFHLPLVLIDLSI